MLIILNVKALLGRQDIEGKVMLKCILQKQEMRYATWNQMALVGLH